MEVPNPNRQIIERIQRIQTHDSNSGANLYNEMLAIRGQGPDQLEALLTDFERDLGIPPADDRLEPALPPLPGVATD